MEDLLEILELAIPASWQQQMTCHDLEPLQQTFAQFVQFCQYLESTEQIPSGTSPKQV